MPSASARSKRPISCAVVLLQRGRAADDAAAALLRPGLLVISAITSARNARRAVDRRLALRARVDARLAAASKKAPKSWKTTSSLLGEVARRTCAARCRRPPRFGDRHVLEPALVEQRHRRLDDLLAGALLLAFPEPRSASPMRATVLGVCRSRNIALVAVLHILCDNWGMALLLGRLAGAAAHHWKRSLLVLVALAALGVLAPGTGFSDDFNTPGTESQRRTTSSPTASRPGRRHGHGRLLR